MAVEPPEASWQAATELHVLLWATRRAAQGKRHRGEVARFLMDAESECLRLQARLRVPLSHPASWQPGAARHFTIADPKRRTITALPFVDRVVHHVRCAQLEPALERYAIHDSYACRVGRGQLAALHRAQEFAAPNGRAISGKATCRRTSPRSRMTACWSSWRDVRGSRCCWD